MGSYSFSIDADGHIYEARMRDALRGLHRVSPTLKFLGSYPRADHDNTAGDAIHSDGTFQPAHQQVAPPFPPRPPPPPSSSVFPPLPLLPGYFFLYVPPTWALLFLFFLFLTPCVRSSTGLGPP